MNYKKYNDTNLETDLNIDVGIQVFVSNDFENDFEKSKKIFLIRLDKIKNGYIEHCTKINRKGLTIYFVKSNNFKELQKELLLLDQIRLMIEEKEKSNIVDSMIK